MRNAKRTTLIVMVICAGFVPVCSARTARRTAKRYSAKQLIAKIIASEKKIHDVECHYDYILKDNYVFTSYDWGYEGGKEYFAGKQFNRARGDKPAYVDYVKVAFDGEKVRRFRDSELDKFTRGRICPFKDGHFIFPTPNRFLGYDISIGRRTFGEILRDVPKISLREQPEVIDGHRCRVLEAIGVVDRKLIFDVRAWIDTERDFRPLKIERYQSIGGKKRWKVVRQQIEKVKLQKIDGVWFPVEGTSSTFFIKNILPPVGMTETEFFRLPRNRVFEEGEFVMMPDRYGSVRIKVYEDTVRINKGIAPKKFTIEFPHGCKVYDDYAEISYTIGEPDKEKTISKSVPVPDSLTVSELLDKYAETQDKLKSFIVKYEDDFLADSRLKFLPRFKNIERDVRNGGYIGEIRSDGDRHYYHEKLWKENQSRFPNSKESAKTSPHGPSILWDGQTQYQYRFSNAGAENDILILRYKGHKGTVSGEHHIKVARDHVLRGTFEDTYERIPFEWINVELSQADTMSVRDKMEEVNGSKCYIIQAKKRDSKYKIWIDPQHGYNIAQVEIFRGGTGVKFGNRREVSLSTYLRNVRFEKIDGIWVPIEADYGFDRRLVNGDFEKEDHHIKRTEFILNSDHDALGSFKTDYIRNGAQVIIGGVRGIRYIWQDGQVVDEKGREVDVDKLIKAESEKVKKPKPKRK